MKGFFVILITGLIMSWMAAEAHRAKARRVGKDLIFPPISAWQILWSIILLMGCGFVFFGLRGPQNEQKTVVTIGFGVVAFAGFTWPKAVELSDFGLQQRSWYGAWKKLSWSEISAVKRKPDGSVVVCGRRCKIALSTYHADLDLFVKELHHHAPSLSIVQTTDL